jgi:hypothetical protein
MEMTQLPIFRSDLSLTVTFSDFFPDLFVSDSGPLSTLFFFPFSVPSTAPSISFEVLWKPVVESTSQLFYFPLLRKAFPFLALRQRSHKKNREKENKVVL